MICGLCDDSDTSIRLVCPARPQLNLEQQDDERWADLGDAPIEALEREGKDLVNLGDEVQGDDGNVVRVPKGLPEPFEPTPQQRARHNLTHWPYCSWCKHCVHGQAVSDPRQGKEEAEFPTISLDYTFFGETAKQRKERKDKEKKGEDEAYVISVSPFNYVIPSLTGGTLDCIE